MTLVLSLAALLVSGLALLLLGIIDPKRRRVRGLLSSSGSRRGIAVALAFAPGFALIAVGAWAALLIWIGGSAVIGWATAIVLAPPLTK